MEVEAIVLDTCKRCGQPLDGVRSNANRDYCRDCAAAARAEAKKDEPGAWLQLAREQGIPVWEQQPGESNEEYEMWVAYRDLWPGVRPTVARVAAALQRRTQTVQRVCDKWTWAARLQGWIREVTAERQAEIRQAKRAMVEEHISMGETLRRKAAEAIEYFDPADVTPSELVSLLKEVQRLETTSRDMLDDVERATAADVEAWQPVDAPAGLFVDTPALGGSSLELPGAQPQQSMSQKDMLEVVDILAKSGYLKMVGVQQTVMVVGDDDI